MGSALDPTAAATYLDALGRWREARRIELDELDATAMASTQGPAAKKNLMKRGGKTTKN